MKLFRRVVSVGAAKKSFSIDKQEGPRRRCNGRDHGIFDDPMEQAGADYPGRWRGDARTAGLLEAMDLNYVDGAGGLGKNDSRGVLKGRAGIYELGRFFNRQPRKPRGTIADQIPVKTNTSPGHFGGPGWASLLPGGGASRSGGPRWQIWPSANKTASTGPLGGVLWQGTTNPSAT